MRIGALGLCLVWCLPFAVGCKKLTVTAKPTKVEGATLSVAVSTLPKTAVGCDIGKAYRAKCDPVTSDASGNATLAITAADELRADIPVNIWAENGNKRATTSLDLKSTPMLATDEASFQVLGTDCGGVLFPTRSPPLQSAICAATMTSGAPAPVAHMPLSFLTGTADAKHSVGIEVQPTPGNKLTGTLQYSDSSLRNEILSAIEKGTPIPGEDKEHPAHAVLLMRAATQPPTVVGDANATIGGLRYIATIAIKRRPSPTPCTYKSKDTGKTVTGAAYFGDADVKVTDRHAKKQAGETTIAATGDPCDFTQKLAADATQADTSATYYKEADVEKWLTHFLSTAKP